MKTFTFKEKKDILIPEGNMFRPITDKDGKELTGEQIVCKYAALAEKFTKTTGKPVPIQQQGFIAWLKQSAAAIKGGATLETILASTVV